MFLINTYLVNLILELFPFFVLGKSTASAEEIEAKKKELKKQLEELEENREERKKVDEQNSIEGDKDSPNEANSAEELEH
jgi:cell shape-determining protein MreC